MTTMNRLRGLRALLEDVVDQGASAVERVHKATAARPFDVLDQIPPVAAPARVVRVLHDATVTGVYEAIRQVNHLVGATLSLAIDAVEAVEAGAASGTSEAHRPDDTPPPPDAGTAR